MLDLAETGWQIGEKLFALLSAEQRRELAQFVFESETSYANPIYLPHQAIFRGKYSIPQRLNHPLTEMQDGRFVLLLGAKACYNPRATDRINASRNLKSSRCLS